TGIAALGQGDELESPLRGGVPSFKGYGSAAECRPCGARKVSGASSRTTTMTTASNLPRIFIIGLLAALLLGCGGGGEAEGPGTPPAGPPVTPPDNPPTTPPDNPPPAGPRLV